jgi:hypothetical protein
MATVRYGISHKDTKHADKCSNNKTETTQKQNDETTDEYFFQNIVKITQKSDTKYTHIMKIPYNKEYRKTFPHIMSHF